MDTETEVAVLTGCFTLLGAVIAIVLSEYLQSKRISRSVRTAILLEMQYLIEVFEFRGYVQKIEAGASEPRHTCQAIFSDKYRSVYDGNSGNLGLLKKSEVETIVQFYLNIESVICDLQPGGAMNNHYACERIFQKNLELLRSALTHGKQLLEK